ncbi:TPA: hypothetical protein I7759_22070 [Vibrio vulnificus]|uniref:Uncharacterized protein n=1 Tax=Vibrio vulnificus TaxID=672 RepID=A0ABX4WVR9_VIBVL|nr:hypothetical protein [Vibrio vulnificus]EGQ9279728.1 hypothetical protein [Vibrio vulnificus]EGQ9939786.1 hypothetical protein [Vibrio vulnificus]EGQ9994117.1 hypothetical protein [Vibrio vulnificus]EGR0050089.1 hypothetical protein [Vibrio vulnificus]EGR0054653.1 hypothetical protein [Vibrio vulnificus]
MNRHNIIGLLSSVLSLSTLVFVIMDGSHFPLLVWPYEAFQGLVFSFVWGFGVSTTVGYLFSIIVTVTVAVVSFALGHKLSRSVVKKGNL